MIIKKETKKKKFFNIINKLLLAYFFLSIAIISIPAAMFLKSSGFKQAQAKFLDKFSRSGRINYIYLPEILYGAFKSNFSKGCSKYLASHPGRVITSDKLASLVVEAWPLSL